MELIALGVIITFVTIIGIVLLRMEKDTNKDALVTRIDRIIKYEAEKEQAKHDKHGNHS